MNKFKRLIAVFLIILTFISVLPVTALTIDNEESTTSESETTEQIVYELEELREENVKHFRFPDGSNRAVVYSTPVHRKDGEGKWKDIDNTLADKTGNSMGYVTSNENLVFSKKISPTSPLIYTYSNNGYSISLSFKNDNYRVSTAKLSNHANKYTPSSDESIETQFNKLKEINNNTTVTYKNIFSHVDLEYVLSGNDIKENIVVRKAQDEYYVYTFEISAEGLNVKLEEDGSIGMYDSSSNAIVYSIPAPYMYDANGTESDAVAYTVTEISDGKYQLTVTADKAWINSSGRALPVTIDPTMIIEECVKDTYVSTSNPTTNYGSLQYMNVSSSETAFIGFNMPNIPTDSTVVSAYMDLSYYYDTTGYLQVGIYPINITWSESSLTFDYLYQRGITGLGNRLTTTYLYESFSTNSSSPETATINITNHVASLVAADSSECGIGIQRIGGTGTSVKIKSSEGTSVYAPFVEITYYCGVIVSLDDNYVLKGGTKSINYISNGNVTWSTSNADVAIVSNGVITGVSEGSAVITASVNTSHNTYSDSITVYVYDWSGIKDSTSYYIMNSQNQRLLSLSSTSSATLTTSERSESTLSR